MPVINLHPIQMTMQELISNPTGKNSAFFSNRLRIKEDLSNKFAKLIYRHHYFQYKTYKVKDSYFFHFKIPSEKWKDKLYYDVVIEFYPTDKESKNDKTINNYYIKVFSNSPSFMFTYTYVCYHNNMIPSSLIPFCSRTALREHPREKNPVEVYGYEKSVYFACLYIIENKLYNKFTLEKELYLPDKNTWAKTITHQEKKLEEYNKLKQQVKKDKVKKHKKALKEVNSSIQKKKKSSNKKTKKK